MDNTLKLRYEVDSQEINYIDMIIKAYEGIGKVNVDHDHPGEIWIDVTKGTKSEVKEVMADLSQNIKIKLIFEESA